MDKKTNEPDFIVPETIDERNRLRELIVRFIDNKDLIPPVSRKQLTALALQLIHEERLDPRLWGWLMVEINNRLWHKPFSAIPHERRILLLPQCLSNSAICTAEIDELGLLCHKCNGCSIHSLEDMAERLGVMSIVTEGFTQVIGLLESGAADAIIGVGCLESLEKVFPLLVDNAVPGMAIALNCDGCKDTDVDAGYVEKITSEFSENQSVIHSFDAEKLKNEIKQWFSAENMAHLLGNTSDQTSQIAREWLGGEGKRWRPYLLVSVFQAITNYKPIPEAVKLAAISVEAFHKASLIHDDIQDNDDFRYGKPTVNALYGVPIAINVGDKLLGDGYKLLSECGIMALVKEAATAHIALCYGQGIELEWCKNPRSLTMNEVIHIFENKTVPAISVPLSFAVICADGDETLKITLEKYAHALGIAFQLLDDLADFQSKTMVQMRPTSVFAAICELCNDKTLIDNLLSQTDISELKNNHKPLLDKAIARVSEMVEDYKQQALDSLYPLKNIELKRLLFRVTKKILK